MTEKEFLIKFLEHYFSSLREVVNKSDKEEIDDFLEQHHQTYYEVEFIRKDETIKEQLVREFGFDPNEIQEIEESEINELNTQKDIVNFIRILDNRVTILEENRS